MLIEMSNIISGLKNLHNFLKNNSIDILKFLSRYRMLILFFVFTLNLFILLCPQSIADMFYLSNMIKVVTPYCFLLTVFMVIYVIVMPLGLKHIAKQDREKEHKAQEIIENTLINTSDCIKEKIHKAYSANKKYIEFENNDTFPSLDLTMLVNNGILKNSSVNIIKNTIEYALTDQAIPIIKKVHMNFK